MKKNLIFHRAITASVHPEISSLCWHLSAQERANNKLIHPFMKPTMLRQQIAMGAGRGGK